MSSIKRLQSHAKVDQRKISTYMNKGQDSDNTDDEKADKKKNITSSFSSSKKVDTAVRFSPFLSLKESMNDKTLQIFKNERFVCIRDKYPKARVHLLLIPLGIQLLRVQDLIKLPNPVEFLTEIQTLADKIIRDHFPSDCKNKSVCGFHAIQSKHPLHMHIITDDFKSDCLKNKKHWNSFNTPYFVRLGELIENLKSEKDYFLKDKFNLNNEAVLKNYLNSDLLCNVCKAKQSNMPNLKKHLLTHQ